LGSDLQLSDELPRSSLSRGLRPDRWRSGLWGGSGPGGPRDLSIHSGLPATFVGAASGFRGQNAMLYSMI